MCNISQLVIFEYFTSSTVTVLYYIICRTAGPSEIYEQSLIGGHSGKSLRLCLYLRSPCPPRFSSRCSNKVRQNVCKFFRFFLFFTGFVNLPNALLLRTRPLLLVACIIYARRFTAVVPRYLVMNASANFDGLKSISHL